MSNETYVYFDIYNHTNQLGVSSYALPFCEFKFIPHLDTVENAGVLSNTKILWVYGDGTTSRSLTGVHAYREPGTYQVYCYLYDNEGQSYLNTYTRNVIVSNYVTDQISLSCANLSSYALTASRIEHPILLTRQNSYQSYSPDVEYSIVPYASAYGLPQSYFDGLSAELFGFLEPYQSFYTQETGPSGESELVETKLITTPSTALYCCLSNNTVIMVDEDHPYSFFCGTSGSELVYYKSDYPVDKVNLFFGFASDIFDVNTSTIGLSATIAPPTNPHFLSVTTSGVDGEFVPISSFGIGANKFVGQKISFVARVKDADWYSIKDLVWTGFSVDILQDSTDSSVQLIKPSSLVISSSANGCIRGYIIPEQAGDNMMLNIVGAVSSRHRVGFTAFDQFTPYFNVLGNCDVTYEYENTGWYFTQSRAATLGKQGEYVDMTQNYKDLRFQELFLDNVNLFDNFIGSIVGNLSSSQDSIGKKVFEKIQNFVDNNSNIEKCNVAQLVSLLESIGDENVLFEKSNFNFPAALKRLIDLLSIKHSNLFGAVNAFDLDFYNYGNSSLYYGKNLGSPITNTLSYMVTAGRDIVALEKYSGTFKKLNTYIPLSSQSVDTIMSTVSVFIPGALPFAGFRGVYYQDPVPVYPETARTWTRTPSGVNVIVMMQNLSGGYAIRSYSSVTSAWNASITNTRLSAYQPWTTGNWRFNNSPTTESDIVVTQLYPNKYQLSAYANDWGWGLVLNDNFTPADLDKYYMFFEFEENGSPSIENSVINFDDFNTTLAHTTSSYSDWTRDNGLIDAMVAYQLAQGLNLVQPLTGTCPAPI